MIAPPSSQDPVQTGSARSRDHLNSAWPDNSAAGATGFGTGNVAPFARALGWFSLGLGLAQLATPRRVAQLIGLPGDGDELNTMRAVGLREIASGLGILAQAKPTLGLWSRVGGDAMDLALLRSAMSSPRADRERVAAATLAVLGITAIDVLCSTRMSAEPDAPYQAMQARNVDVTAAVTVQAPAGEVFALWDGFQGLPRFMRDAASVQITGERQSHWTMLLPAGVALDWDVIITDSWPQDQIAWRTGEDSAVNAEGVVRFRAAPGGRGTQVIFTARFSPPGGELGKKIAAPFAEALGTKMGNDLRRFKQLVELGEIVQSDDSVVPGPNPAQPRPQPATGTARSVAA